MDELLKSSIELERKRSPEERLVEALEMMEWGIRLKESQLRTQHPGATEEELDGLLDAWLRRDD